MKFYGTYLKIILAIFVLFNLSLKAQNIFTSKQIDSLLQLSFEDKISNPSKSFLNFQKALKIAENSKSYTQIADVYSNLALVSFYKGDFEKHTKYSLEAIRMHEKLKQYAKLSKDYAEYGYQLKKRDLEKGIVYMQKGKIIAENNHYEFELRAIYDNYGVLKEFKNELDSALYYYDKSLQLKLKANDSVGIPYSLNNIAGIHLLKKNFSQAKDNFDKAFQIRKSLKDSIGMAETLFSYGNLYEAQKQNVLALAYYKKSNLLAKKIGYKNIEKDSYQSLATILEQMEQNTEAFLYFKKFHFLNDSLNNVTVKNNQAQLDTAFQTKEKENIILEQEASLAKKNLWFVLVFGLLVFSMLIGYLFYYQQKTKAKQIKNELDLKVALASVETQNKLNEQRVSISRDLHDNIGSQLTFIISSIDSLKYFLNGQNEKIDKKLDSLSIFAKTTIDELRDTIWAMNQQEITLEDLFSRFNNYVQKARTSIENTKLNFVIEESNVTMASIKLTSKDGVYLYRILQEAINNALKYAKASVIEVNIKYDASKIGIKVVDNGEGFDFDNVTFGNGLNNMKTRANEIEATIDIKSELGIGTTIFIEKNT